MTNRMTNFAILLFALTILISCGSSSTDQKEGNKTGDTLKEGIDTLISVENIKSASNKVTCTEEETKNENGGEPILTKTCLYKSYKFISKGFPDFNGRYSYEYSVYKMQDNGSYAQIKNASLFNKNELLSIINSKIETDYKSYSNDSESKDCFEGASFTPFNFDQLGIAFNEDKIEFNVTFGLIDVCKNVDGTVVSINLGEIQKYLIE